MFFNIFFLVFFILVHFFILWQISCNLFYLSLFIFINLHLIQLNNTGFQEEAC